MQSVAQALLKKAAPNIDDLQKKIQRPSDGEEQEIDLAEK
jgi:hypothetical protein